MQLAEQLAFMRACGPITSLPASRDVVRLAHQKAAAAARAGDVHAAGRAIAALAGLLDFRANPGLAGDLLSVYRHCLALLQRGRCFEAAGALDQLGRAWQERQRAV